MNPYSRHTLNLKRGDRIVWLDKPRTVVHPNGRIEVYLRAGMRGRVVAIHDGVPPSRLDSLDSSLLPWATVKMRNGHKAFIDSSVRWEKED